MNLIYNPFSKLTTSVLKNAYNAVTNCLPSFSAGRAYTYQPLNETTKKVEEQAHLMTLPLIGIKKDAQGKVIKVNHNAKLLPQDCMNMLGYIYTRHKIVIPERMYPKPKSNQVIINHLNNIASKFFPKEVKDKFIDLSKQFSNLELPGVLRAHAQERAEKMLNLKLFTSTQKVIKQIEKENEKKVYKPANLLLHVREQMAPTLAPSVQASADPLFFASFSKDYDALKSLEAQLDGLLIQLKAGTLTSEQRVAFEEELNEYNARASKLMNEFYPLSRSPEMLTKLNGHRKGNKKITDQRIEKLFNHFRKEARTLGFERKFEEIKTMHNQYKDQINSVSEEVFDEMKALVKGYLTEQVTVTLPGENLALVKSIAANWNIASKD